MLPFGSNTIMLRDGLVANLRLRRTVEPAACPLGRQRIVLARVRGLMTRGETIA
jgi:hypothetical protein